MMTYAAMPNLKYYILFLITRISFEAYQKTFGVGNLVF